MKVMIILVIVNFKSGRFGIVLTMIRICLLKQNLTEKASYLE